MTRAGVPAAQSASPNEISVHIPDEPAAARTIAALARVEGRKLITHAAFLSGAGFLLLGVVWFVLIPPSPALASWRSDSWMVSVGLGTLALLTMVATNLASIRDRREGTTEQHRALPTSESARTGALLLATWWPAAASGIAYAAVLGYGATVYPITGPDLVQLAGVVMAIVMLGTLGITLGIWLPNPFIVPVFALGLWITGEPVASWEVLYPLVRIDSVELALWHLAYLVGLIAILSAAALLRPGYRHSLLVIAVLGVAVVAIAAVNLVPEVCPLVEQCLH